MLFPFLSTDGISFECLSVIPWTPLSWNSLLICSSSSKLWGLPCPCSSCIGTVSAGHQPVSVHVPHVIHPQICSLCYLKKDTSFWFLFFFPLSVSRRLQKYPPGRRDSCGLWANFRWVMVWICLGISIWCCLIWKEQWRFQKRRNNEGNYCSFLIPSLFLHLTDSNLLSFYW